MGVGVGLASFVAGVRLAYGKGFKRFVWAPMAVGLAAAAVLLFFAWRWAQAALGWATAWLPSWLEWLAALLAPLLALVGVVAAGWLSGLVAVVAASPFLGILAAKAERAAFGDAPVVEEGFGAALANACRRELAKLRYHLPRLAALLLLALVPGANVAAPLLWLLVGAWLLALQFVDYAAENRGLPLAATRALLARHRAAALAFGGLATLALAVPLAAPFVIPAAVCGGVVLWRRLCRPAERLVAATSRRADAP